MFCCNQSSSFNAEPTGSLLSQRDGFGFTQTTEAPEFKDSAQMTATERERAYNQLHCVSDGEPAEDPKAILRGLHELDQYIVLFKARNFDSAYHLAERQNKSYVEDRKFRLMFLRADNYNPRQAALRIMRFFDEKMRLFGKEKLTQEILYDDLSDDDRESLESGAMQICPVKDRAGRYLFAGKASMKKYKKVADYVRAQFYLLMSTLEDESTQIKGLNFVFFNDTPTNDRDLVWQTSVMRHAIPIRLSTGHACLHDRQNIALRGLCQLGAQLSDLVSRSSYRFHFGAHTEVIYALMGYGIPVFALPFATEDEYDLENHRKWIQERIEIDKRKKEERRYSSSTASMTTEDEEWSSLLQLDLLGEEIDEISIPETMDEIDGSSQVLSGQGWPFDASLLFIDDIAGEVAIDDAPVSKENGGLDTLVETSDLAPVGSADLAPPETVSSSPCDPPKAGVISEATSADVLMGRGRPLQKHPGNVYFRKLISERIEEYENSCKTKKTKLALEVMEIIKESSGRFLKPARDLKTSTVEGGEWEEIDDLAARQKVAFTFRSVRKCLKKQ